jgi:hypothetical protein
VARALADPRRPAEQVSLDATRKPAQLISFAQLKRGYRIADFMPGNAYFTRIMSDLVGDSGHVYAFLPAEQLANCPPQEVAGIRLLEHDPSYANVSVLSDATANFRVPRKLDVIWTAQNYHDLHDSFMGPADVAALNKRFFEALKPGGVYLVIEHVAETGSDCAIPSRCTELIHCGCARKLKPRASYSMQRATCCATAQTIINRRCSIAACEAEPIRSCIGSGSLDEGSVFGTKPAEFTGSMQYFNDRTRFRSLCRRQGRQSYAAVDRRRQSVAARQ